MKTIFVVGSNRAFRIWANLLTGFTFAENGKTLIVGNLIMFRNITSNADFPGIIAAHILYLNDAYSIGLDEKAILARVRG